MIVFTLIIPVYNVEKYIIDCLKSLTNQKYTKEKYEIIIINDKSNDQSLKKIKKFKNKLNNLLIINNKKKSGTGQSRNKGIKAAKGRYLLFIDGDDILYKNSLNIIEKLIRNKDYDFIGYNFNKILPKNKIAKLCRKDFKFIKQNKKTRIKNFLKGEIDGSVIFTVFNKKFIEKNKIFFHSNVHEDIFYIFRTYFFSAKFILINKALYLKRSRKGSITNTLYQNRISGLFNQILHIKKFLIKHKENFSYFSKSFVIGFVGYAGYLLTTNYKLNNSKIKNLNYKLIYNYLKKNIYYIKRRNQSKKDKIVNLFIECMKKKDIFKNQIKIYEKKVINLL